MFMIILFNLLVDSTFNLILKSRQYVHKLLLLRSGVLEIQRQ